MTFNSTPVKPRRTWLKVVGAVLLPPLGFWFLWRSPRTKAVKTAAALVLGFYSVFWLAAAFAPKPAATTAAPVAATASPSISVSAAPTVHPSPSVTVAATPSRMPAPVPTVTPSSAPAVVDTPTPAPPVYTDAPQAEPTTHQAAGCTTDSKGHCIVRGRYCPGSDHGGTGTDANGTVLTCEDKNGWRWE